MNISTVRTNLTNWLSNLVRIDSFSLDIPRDLSSPLSTNLLNLPGNTLRQYPAEKIHYKKIGINSVEGSAIFPFSIIYRYPGYLQYKELPISQLESLLEYIQGNALMGDLECGFKKVEVDSTDASVNPQRLGGLIREPVNPKPESIDQNENDWVIYINFSFTITYALTTFVLPPEFGTDPGVNLINYPKDIKIYDAGIPLSKVNARLDADYIKTPTP